MLFLKSSIELFHFEKSSNLKEDFEKRKKEGPPFLQFAFIPLCNTLQIPKARINFRVYTRPITYLFLGMVPMVAEGHICQKEI